MKFTQKDHIIKLLEFFDKIPKRHNHEMYCYISKNHIKRNIMTEILSCLYTCTHKFLLY